MAARASGDGEQESKEPECPITPRDFESTCEHSAVIYGDLRTTTSALRSRFLVEGFRLRGEAGNYANLVGSRVASATSR